MERTMYKGDEDKGFDEAFETTYLVVTGKIKLENLGKEGREIFMLYDPIDVDEKELREVLEDMILYFIETEEYEKCQEIKEILDKSLKVLMPKITYSDLDILPLPKKKSTVKENSIDKMINLLKNFSEKEKSRLDKKINDGTFLDGNKKYSGEITSKEFWSILSIEDKAIFENDFQIFNIWLGKLDKRIKEYYLERLVQGKSLIPPFEGYNSGPENAGTWPSYNESEKFSADDIFEGEEEIDYENKVVISFIDNFTCISNFDLKKINRIRFQLLSFGILETEIRIKKIDNRNLYTLVYDSQQNINKIDWN